MSPPPVPEDTLGLHELWNPQKNDPGAVIKADLVAVHGLGGDAFTTWTHPDSHFLWLRDQLPTSLQSLRIFTFGYNANLFVNGARGRSFTFAEDLLSQLHDERAGVGHRPLFFAGHSLGGIVIKKALIMARMRSKKYEDILHCTRHIFFFGTPHQGANKTAFVNFLNKLVGGLQLDNSTSAVDELSLWSDSLLDTLASFSEIASNLSFTTFWETKPTKGIQIVEEGSARMNLSTETPVSLSANHKEVCKFRSVDDSNYRSVIRRINAELGKLQDARAIREHEGRFRDMNSLYFEVPFPQNPNFVRRDNIFKRLDEKLGGSSDSIVVLHGLGGVG
ncbi:MAG: hypothetical protein M1833_001331 [Piccolia ochrophora]|nr:MAG: hypothetical protein M1833_001331 [Piccolia ochrophora]